MAPSGHVMLIDDRIKMVDIVGVFPASFMAQFFAQTIHALSFGLFHMIAMRVIFQNFFCRGSKDVDKRYIARCGALAWRVAVFWLGIIGIKSAAHLSLSLLQYRLCLACY